jgi:hypothetical protein
MSAAWTCCASPSVSSNQRGVSPVNITLGPQKACGELSGNAAA